MSPLIDDRGRLFGRVSVVDLFVLLLIVAVGVFAWTRFSGDTGTTVPVHLRVWMEKQRDPTFKPLNVGDTVTDDGGTVLGTIVLKDERETLLDVPDAQGYLHTDNSGVYIDIYVDITGQGVVHDGRVVIGGKEMLVGQPLMIKGPNYQFKTVILEAAPGK